MSQENVETVRSAFASFNQGDTRTWLEHYDPDVAWHTSEENPDSDIHRGHEALAELIATWREMFEGLRIEPAEFIDAVDYVITPTRVRGRGTTSGAEIDMERTYSARLRDGRMVEVWEHRTKAQALEALGLSEQDAHADS